MYAFILISLRWLFFKNLKPLPSNSRTCLNFHAPKFQVPRFPGCEVPLDSLSLEAQTSVFNLKLSSCCPTPQLYLHPKPSEHHQLKTPANAMTKSHFFHLQQITSFCSSYMSFSCPAYTVPRQNSGGCSSLPTCLPCLHCCVHPSHAELQYQNADLTTSLLTTFHGT